MARINIAETTELLCDLDYTTRDIENDNSILIERTKSILFEWYQTQEIMYERKHTYIDSVEQEKPSEIKSISRSCTL
jgi:hypothetical protein